ncbi:MAG: methylenetetrahydrofolate reductase C-terminal domain-containing protein [Candidatus Latescibacter sp.]|nr:methylenetetrahydrofolate reductase C-terminal domain-containing protein [Candidatus Latescibacter sp.]
MEDKTDTLKYLISESDRFVITCEHIPGRVSHDKKLDEILAFAEKCRDTGLVHALSLTDNPGGTPAISPDMLALEIEKIGIPALVHFPAKDMNRNMVESRALALDRMGLRNVLVMSGDFQTAGQLGLAMPVFDLDPIHILTMFTLMNRGKRVNFTDRSLEDGPRTDFFHGAVVSPYKNTEVGLMFQLYKMEMKARAGAQFFITQLGFDARKLKDFMQYIRENRIEVPVLGSVFILRKGAAAAMSRGDVAGAMVTDELLQAVSREAEEADKGKAGSLERAAMQVAVLMGLGFRGAHIEAMVLKFDMVETILGRAAELKPNWEECIEKLNFAPTGAYYLGQTGATAHSPATSKLRGRWGTYLLMRLLHKLFFVKDGALSGIMRFTSRILDSVKPLGAVSHFFEHAAKQVLFDCRDCGDCALPELQFLCPQSQCPKQERNGPCGGSRLDACEVYPDRPCVWNRVYIRAKQYGELEQIRTTVIGPRDWKLRETSGWVNFHLNRDHTSYDFTSFFEEKDAEKKR